MSTYLANAMQPDCLLALALGVLILVAILWRRGRREDASGPRLGPYVVTDILGEGAMGIVYRARHATLGREVAIKILRRDVVTDPQRVLRTGMPRASP